MWRTAVMTLMACLLLALSARHARAEATTPETCRIVVHNGTEHEVTLYADGRCLGSVAPRSTRYALWERGDTWLYGRAVCHPMEWGSTRFALGESFTWSLTP